MATKKPEGQAPQPDGRWLLDEPHHDALHADLEGGEHPARLTGFGLVFSTRRIQLPLEGDGQRLKLARQMKAES